MRNPKLLKKENTALLVIDIQEKLFNVMYDKDIFLSNCSKLIKGCKELQIPIYYTEQYPKGLGQTQSDLLELLKDYPKFEKDTFSCASVTELINELKSKNIHYIILCGIESHICILQTAFDFDTIGFHTFVVANGVTSRNRIDYDIAIKRLAQSNIQIVTVEMTLLEMIEKSGTEIFKKISHIIK